MRWLLLLLLEARVEKMERELVKHGERCCVGVEAHCYRWAAINDQYDDAVDRYRAAKK